MRTSILLAAAMSLVVGCAQPTKRTEVAKKEQPPYCLTETGSRIPPKNGECNNQPGRSVDRDEIDRTGAMNTSDVIKQTVPQAH